MERSSPDEPARRDHARSVADDEGLDDETEFASVEDVGSDEGLQIDDV
jgi:hypothetical protein